MAMFLSFVFRSLSTYSIYNKSFLFLTVLGVLILPFLPFVPSADERQVGCCGVVGGRCFSESPFHKGCGVWGPSAVRMSIPLAFFVRLGHQCLSQSSQKGFPGLV